MSNIQPMHILSQMGVLSSFSIAKKVTDEDMRKYFSKQRRGKSESELQELLKDKVMTEIATAIETNAVPGLISPQEMAKEAGLDNNVVKNVPELNRLVAVIATKLSEKNYDRMSLCYFINTTVNLLGLTERDFDRFHRSRPENNDDDDDNNEFKDA